MSAAKKINLEDIDAENMTIEQAAVFLGMAKGTLYNMRYKGLGPKFRKAPGGIKYRLKDLEHWKNQNTLNPETITSK